jgi:hypothetical protein
MRLARATLSIKSSGYAGETVATKAGRAARQIPNRSCFRAADPAGAVAVADPRGDAGEVWKPVFAKASLS